MTLPLALAAAVVLAIALPGCAPQAAAGIATQQGSDAPARVLVFTRTAGYRHDAIPATVDTLRTLAAGAGLAVDASEDPAVFNAATLSRHSAVVFAHTTREVLERPQQAAFERYVADGGGFMGVHAAADSGYTWPWYGELVGAWFARHPDGLQSVRVVFEQDAPAGADGWHVTDEIYDYQRNPRADVQVIASIDPASHPRGGMGDDHPIAWCHGNAGGPAWYTGLGHDPALYADPVFRAHLLRGLRHVSGQSDTC